MGPATVLLVGQLLALLTLALGGILERDLYLTGKAVAAWTPCTGVAPWELSSLQEGDRLPSPVETRMVFTEEKRKWPDKTLPFIVDDTDFTFLQNRKLNDVFRELNDVKCVTLRRATPNDTDYVRITGQNKGCYASYWGRKGGEQIINLQPPACLQRGTIYHMLFHIFGFCHVHNNPIRDSYIFVNFDNVIESKKGFLVKYENDSRITDFLYRYDFDSVMHASRRAYSKNNRDTIETWDPTIQIGQRVGPSFFDLQKLRSLYDCVYDPPGPHPEDQLEEDEV